MVNLTTKKYNHLNLILPIGLFMFVLRTIYLDSMYAFVGIFHYALIILLSNFTFFQPTTITIAIVFTALVDAVIFYEVIISNALTSHSSTSILLLLYVVFIMNVIIVPFGVYFGFTILYLKNVSLTQLISILLTIGFILWLNTPYGWPFNFFSSEASPRIDVLSILFNLAFLYISSSITSYVISRLH